MAKTLLVCDELDGGLGLFFGSCLKNLELFFTELDIENEVLKNGQLNDLSVQLKTNLLDKFIFVAYSHGYTNCLLNANIPYISTTMNDKCFNNSFFYTFSCSSGSELASHLINNGCLCYIGYNKEVAIWSTFITPFVECANHGLKQFFLGDDTATVYKKMDEKYNVEIDAIYKKDFMIASILRENRDALILNGININILDFDN